GPLLERLAAGFAPAAAARGLRLRARPTQLWVDSDPVLLERVLLNLIGNALRYTVKGGVLVGTRQRGGQVEIIVADTGIGIAPEQQTRVFQEFYRGPDAPANGEVGLGLGLAIVRRLMILLGHAMALHSMPGRGSCFALTLPLPPQHAEPLAGRRVLVVVDDATIVEATRGQLAQWGCVVTVAGDSVQACALWRAAPAELVLTDLRLANGEDGRALAQRLRSAGPGRRAAKCRPTRAGHRCSAALRLPRTWGVTAGPAFAAAPALRVSPEAPSLTATYRER
ncbi:MAG: hybrid sensor histidine kinase/response regulator, partial [Rhizobacter sp.]|nr:hybrid sensor histidine kinase/response regulator [Rhizobacter sp.]